MALETLSKTGIVDGQTIQDYHVTQSIDALTGTVGYALTVSGSFTLVGTTGSGYFASSLTTDQVRPESVVSDKGYTVPYLNGTGSSSPLNYNAYLTYNPVTDLLNTTSSQAISSSRAISSSYADNVAVSQVNTQQYDNGISVVPGDFKFVAGTAVITAGSATSSIFSNLIGKTLGTNAWITANYSSGYGPTDVIAVTSISSSGAILFDNQQPGSPASAILVFTGIYI